jgi:hypothetical protein
MVLILLVACVLWQGRWDYVPLGTDLLRINRFTQGVERYVVSSGNWQSLEQATKGEGTQPRRDSLQEVGVVASIEDGGRITVQLKESTAAKLGQVLVVSRRWVYICSVVVVSLNQNAASCTVLPQLKRDDPQPTDTVTLE